MTEIYPQATEGRHPTVDEESLAATLLRRLDISEEPTAKPADEDDEQDAVAEPKAGKEDQEPVLV
jgi:hypothetical protein